MTAAAVTDLIFYCHLARYGSVSDIA